MTSPARTGSSSPLLFILAFVAIYFVWGSTYLAIRYAVEAIPPLLTAGLRHLVAGGSLFLWCRLRGQRASLIHWRASLIVGALFFLVGHGTLHWAEQFVPSGLAALIVATEPIWIAILMAIGPNGTKLRGATVFGLAAGLLGVGLLMGSEMIAASGALFLGSAAILVGAISWALGIRYSVGAPLPRDPILRAATTLLAGSALLLVSSIMSGEVSGFDPTIVPARSVLGLGYLIVFGSIVTFTAYLWLLDRCSATLVATHTYVNPVVAMLLGWALAGEPIGAGVLFAAGFILGSIVLINAGSAGAPGRARRSSARIATRPQPQPRA